jgi:hypothetical protein
LTAPPTSLSDKVGTDVLTNVTRELSYVIKISANVENFTASKRVVISVRESVLPPTARLVLQKRPQDVRFASKDSLPTASRNVSSA